MADDTERRTAYQRVGRRWSLTPLGDWRGEPRLSRLVVIGRKGTFDGTAVARELRECTAG